MLKYTIEEAAVGTRKRNFINTKLAKSFCDGTAALLNARGVYKRHVSGHGSKMQGEAGRRCSVHAHACNGAMRLVVTDA